MERYKLRNFPEMPLIGNSFIADKELVELLIEHGWMDESYFEKVKRDMLDEEIANILADAYEESGKRSVKRVRRLINSEVRKSLRRVRKNIKGLTSQYDVENVISAELRCYGKKNN